MSHRFAKLKHWLAPIGPSLPSVYLVGGAVRDHLLGREPNDLDLMCPDPGAFAQELARARDAAVVLFAGKADAPCFRVVDRTDPTDYLDIVDIRGGSVVEDLRCRDFSVNAMALSILPGGGIGDLLDPCNGREDLSARRIRATGPHVFRKDPVRILRAFRFAAQLDFSVATGTMSLMRGSAALLADAPGERVSRELFKVLECPASGPLIRELDEIGAWGALFPAALVMKGVIQNRHHHLDVWELSLAVLEGCEGVFVRLDERFGPAAARVRAVLESDNRLPMLKLAALFHDAGKPDTRVVEPEKGRVTFYGHETAGGHIASVVAERLKMSNSDRRLLEDLVKHHMMVLTLSEPNVRTGTALKWFRRLGETMIPLIVLSMADTAATLGPDSRAADRERHFGWAVETLKGYYAGGEARLQAKPLVTGRDLINLGLPPGPRIGRILRTVREFQDEGAISNREEALERIRHMLTID